MCCSCGAGLRARVPRGGARAPRAAPALAVRPLLFSAIFNTLYAFVGSKGSLGRLLKDTRLNKKKAVRPAAPPAALAVPLAGAR